ncbi:hypothetical protein ACJX0J_009780, partial [Zea mays]
RVPCLVERLKMMDIMKVFGIHPQHSVWYSYRITWVFIRKIHMKLTIDGTQVKHILQIINEQNETFTDIAKIYEQAVIAAGDEGKYGSPSIVGERIYVKESLEPKSTLKINICFALPHAHILNTSIL